LPIVEVKLDIVPGAVYGRRMNNILFLPLVVTSLMASGAQAAADPVRIDLAAEQSFNLGVTQAIPVTLTADPSFKGTVALSLNLDEITQASAGGRVKASLKDTQITLEAGQSVQTEIDVTVDTMTPTISGAHLGLEAQVTSPTVSTHLSNSVAVSVVPTYEIHLYGGPVPESWDSPKSASFAPHAEGVLVRFINRDTQDSHVIHSVGPIPHGDTNNPLKPAPAAGQDGDVYEWRVTDTTKMKDIYYCHVHESGAQERVLLFNQ
jgi:hypothetical protein